MTLTEALPARLDALNVSDGTLATRVAELDTLASRLDLVLDKMANAQAGMAATPYPVGTFGARLQRLRTAAGLTQSELAQRSGLSMRSIQGWEQDYRTAHVYAVHPLARALQCPPGALVDSICP
jgi:DNA-binding XRE family transcriptional regulator